MRRSGVLASRGANIVGAMLALLDICMFRKLHTSSSGTVGYRVVRIISTNKEMRRSGVRASPGANISAAMFPLLDICVFR